MKGAQNEEILKPLPVLTNQVRLAPQNLFMGRESESWQLLINFAYGWLIDSKKKYLL